jgi:hypothetical protein
VRLSSSTYVFDHFVADRFAAALFLALAERTTAAAIDAFFARAERSSGVRFLAEAFPPCRPNLRAISFIAARTSGGIFTLML